MIEEHKTSEITRAIQPLVEAHPGKCGIFPLARGRDAFAARMLLADATEHTLDVQYYIWHNDMSGTLLFEALRRAADRRVRVRLLLDDNNTAGLDTVLAALNAHPHIEVRLFNPFKLRRFRILNYLLDFARLNRRMHNKSFTADDRATIIGGRNVGDEYFDAGKGALFVDLDVLAIGPVVNDVSRDFEAYWTSASSYPADRVLSRATPESISCVAAAAARITHQAAPLAFIKAADSSTFAHELLAGSLPFEWANVRMVSDDPAKGRGFVAEKRLLWERLKQIVGHPKQELKLVSAYFVPRVAGVQTLIALAKQGVKIAIVTNSLEATDVAAVHAGYAKYRKPLLKAGIRLFEMKRMSPRSSPKDRGPASSSASSLHAKTFSVDRSCVFIGSFNFDPRSARLNTEIGFVINSPALAKEIDDAISAGLPTRAYQLRLSAAGALQWVEQQGGKQIVHDEEPGVGFWRRLSVSALALLPIEWLL